MAFQRAPLRPFSTVELWPKISQRPAVLGTATPLRRYAATPLRNVTNSTTPLNACDRRCHLTTLTERLKHRTRAIVHGGKKGAKSKN
jgi:hypothetical protein